jgi:hypothetical protein
MKSLLVVVMGLLLIGSVASAADIITDSATGPGAPVSPDALCGTYHLSQNIEPYVFTGGTVTCGSVPLNYVTESWALRRMNLYWEFGIDGPFIVECVRWGVRRFSALSDSIPGPYSVDVNLYSIPVHLPLIFANMTFLTSRPEAITTADNPVAPAIGVWKTTVFDTSFDSFDGMLDLVVAIHYPETHSLTPSVRFAPSTASSLGETAASYVAFEDCGYPEPVTPGSLGIPTAMFDVVLEGHLAAPGGFGIAAWGQNDLGQCNVPAPNADFVAIAGGNKHSLGLKSDGTIVAWGYNGYGQCTVPAPNAGFMGVAGGGYNSLGLKSDGTIVAWGINNYGQGDVPAPNAGFAAIAGGDAHCLGLKSDGTIVAWGYNNYGQCVVPAPNAGFVAIAAGQSHSLGLKSDGTIVAWGANTYGQCVVPAPNAGFVGVAAGLYHSIGLKYDGTIVLWGRNSSGECNVPAPNTGFVAIDGGNGHSLGLKSDGTIVAWGANNYGQCDVPSPDSGFVAVAAGYGHSLGLRSSLTSAVDDPNSGGAAVPDPFRIVSVTPNPIAGSAEILFEARESGPASMTVHDVGGRRLTTSALGSFEPGRHQVRWVARDAAGLRLPSGVYFLRLQGVAGKPSAARVLLIR